MNDTLKKMMAHANEQTKTTKPPAKENVDTNSKVRENIIHLRLNDYEKSLLDETANKLGTTKATALRMAAVEYARKHGVI